MIENIYDAIQLLAADGTILYASPAIVRTGGRTPDEVVGHKAFEWSHPDDLVGLGEAFDTFLHEAGSSQRVESRYQHKDGSWRWAEATCTNLLDEPAVRAVVVNVHDITDRKRAEDELRASNELLQAVTEETTDAIVVKSADGRYLLANAAAATLLSTDREELLGRYDADLFSASVAAKLRADDLEVMTAGAARTYEEVVPTPAGPRILLTTKAPYHGVAGAETGVVGISRDITDLKKLEDQLRQAQKMEAVGRLAGGVAHDFNNLLTIINGYSDIVLASLPEHSPARAMLEEVRKAGERATGLTRQLLAFSRQQILHPQLLDLNEVVSELVKMLRRMIGEDVELIFKPGAGLLRVEADPGQLEQVLMNLVVNARDAMETGGRLTLETRNESLVRGLSQDSCESRPEPYVMISVADTGTGMPPEVAAHMFEPFFTTKPPGKGTGLGLAIVYGIIQQSGGHIDLETTLGQGTTFRLYLPAVAAAPSAAATAGSVPPLPSGTETILIVEDEDGVRSLTRLMLKQLGYTVVTASSAEQALTLCRQSAPVFDLMLTDVVMPGQSGRGLAERLHELNPQLAVLYMSGYTDDAVVRHGVAQDSMNFLQKPFTAATLARKVREVLDARLHLRANSAAE